MGHSSHKAWLAIGIEAWLLGAEAGVVMALRGGRLALGGAAAWQEAQRMVTEKVAAQWALGMEVASGRAGASADALARHTLRHYGRRVRANRRRLGGS